MEEGTRIAVDRLLELVRSPRDRVLHGDWSEVEADLRVPLPPDFVVLSTAWGEGALVDHVNFPSPDRFLEWAAERLSWERESRETSDVSGPDLWPVPGGLVPWADTWNGDMLWWRTGGPSETWTVAANEARNFDIVQTEWKTAEALVAYLEGRTSLFGEFETDLEPWFSAARDRAHIEWVVPSGAAVPEEESLVATVAEVLPIKAPRGNWSDRTAFHRHWVTGKDEWDVSVHNRGLRVTCPLHQEEDARRAAAEIGRRLGFEWNESWVSRVRRDES